MRTYIDHLEIESQRLDEAWKHVGNIYPKYRGYVWRPWYFFWLVRRRVMVNEIPAWITCFKMAIRDIHALPKSKEKVRLVIWLRQGKKLIQAGAIFL